MTINYLSPVLRENARGGAAKLYDHCAVLRKNGFDAVVCYQPLGNNSFIQREFTEVDLIVVPEIYGDLIYTLPREAPRLAYCQNGYLVDRNVSDTSHHPYEYCDELLGIMVDSKHTASIIEQKYPNHKPIILTHPCVNGRDGEDGPFRFSSWPRKKEIVYFGYKHEVFVERIVSGLDLPHDWKVVCMTGMTDEEVAEAYRNASIFLAPNVMEGLCAPTQEALISGTYIVGWFGGGTEEYLEGRGTFVEQGNIPVLRAALEDIAERINAGWEPPSKEWSDWVRGKYSRENEIKEIVSIMNSMAGKPSLTVNTQPQISNQAPAPIFSILHATAHRLPFAWVETWREWSRTATHPEACEYIVSVHESDMEKVKEGVNSIPQDENGIHIVVTCQSNRYCAVDNWNTAAKASKGRILIMGADDFFPAGMNWDGALLNAVIEAGKKPMEDAFALHVDVGCGDPNLATHPIMSRALYEKWGYFLFPEYEGVYCDNDFTAHAHLDKAMIDARHLHFDHRHPIRNGRDVFLKAVNEEEGYKAQNTRERYEQGEVIFRHRKANGFSNHHPLIDKNKKNLFICIPGEEFSSAWMNHWTSLMLNLPLKYNVFPCNVHCSNVYTTRLALAKEALSNQPKPDYILWIDDDNLVTLQQVEQLIQDLEDHPEIDMVAGWCWIQSDDPSNGTKVSCGLFHKDGSCVSLKADAMLSTDATVPPVLEIEWTGFPVVLMRRECLEKAGDTPFSPVPTIHGRFGFMGEDVAFCRVAKDRGNCRFMVDRRIHVPHLKLRPVVHDNAEFATPVNQPVLVKTMTGERK